MRSKNFLIKNHQTKNLPQTALSDSPTANKPKLCKKTSTTGIHSNKNSTKMRRHFVKHGIDGIIKKLGTKSGFLAPHFFNYAELTIFYA